MRTALTIAGSDSGGGAGIQADLKSFAAVGVHGTSVVTCVTAQNTRSVDSIFPLPVDEVRKQLRSVLRDFDVRAAKTGMLYSADIVRTVATGLSGTAFPLVVDPVMVATVGASLEREGFRDALVDRLFPRADLVTPNRVEAERLAGMRIRRVEDAEKAARSIRKLGPGAVLVKGGHLAGHLVDVFYDGRSLRRLEGFRHEKELHGAGCTLAASVAGYLALGAPLVEAVQSARRRVAAGFLASYRAGRGVELIDSHVIPDRYAVWEAVTDAAPRFAEAIPVDLAPEVGINVGYALPGAGTSDDVCALRGRIVRVGDRLEPIGPAAFGASKHVARVILTAMRFDPAVRSATNLKYRGKNARRLRSARLALAAFDRAEEPEGVSSLEWGTERAIVEAGVIPDGIYDEGAVGKEPMLRVLGEDPIDVLRKVRRIVRAVAP
ncbi:MAG: bifunctional hydroxymethylpyrimidine kinase/phosphomethylpyrimidine kinase [Methanobacteriota archaeon]